MIGVNTGALATAERWGVGDEGNGGDIQEKVNETTDF